MILIKDSHLPDINFANTSIQLNKDGKVLIQELLKEKDLFKHIFKTEKGSIYFTLKTGESLRIKYNENKKCFEAQPLLNKIIFVDEKEADIISSKRKSGEEMEYFFNSGINKTSYKKGAIPIEIGINGKKQIEFSERDDNIKILGTRSDDGCKLYHFFASGYHIGHKITEIIK